ncbi:tubulin epsilon and delta complex protein 1 [Mastacembelus armatus]|uniref:tubulin epsilon and delta complex protein 1 n=1 Tax=Mastacembelus armatus TaxID=205130 RepID=UPI000E45CD5A|nr:tubulin epsilon and delta complex protein 1 [Mastacembelus armatus]
MSCAVVVMQRSKASVTVEVKQVVGTLCRLLAVTGLGAVPVPEAFRRAKFGAGLEVENQFWQLLADILERAGIIYPEASAQLRDHRKLVAAGLWQTGYYADWMYGKEGGDGKDGRSFSSKDLLLALGWLLATETLEKLLTQRVQQLDKTLLMSITVNTQVSHKPQFDLASLRRLHWLIGCLRHQGRTLMSMLEERTCLLHAVFSASVSTTAFPSSSDESPAVLKDDSICMWQLCDLLDAYLNWKQVEKIFWTWMDSVVDCHLTDPVKESTHSPHLRTSVCHHGNQGLEKLEDVLLRLPTAQKGHRRGRGEGEDRGAESLQDRLDTASTLSLPFLSQVYRARLQSARPVKHGSYPAEGHQGRAKAPDELPSSKAAQLLLQTEALLLKRRDRQRQVNRMQLQEVIGRLDELVLIPP